MHRLNECRCNLTHFIIVMEIISTVLKASENGNYRLHQIKFVMDDGTPPVLTLQAYQEWNLPDVGQVQTLQLTLNYIVNC